MAQMDKQPGQLLPTYSDYEKTQFHKVSSKIITPKTIGTVFFILICLEAYSKYYGTFTQPSVIMDNGVENIIYQLSIFGHNLGIAFNHICKLFNYAQIQTMIYIIYDLFKPFLKLIMTPFYIGLGFAFSYSDNPYAIMDTYYFSVFLIGLCLVPIFAAAFVETGVRKVSKTYTPSRFLMYVSWFVSFVYAQLGGTFALISSFLTNIIEFLNLSEYVDSVIAMFNIFLNFAFSPLRMIYGYLKTAESYKYPILVLVGSIILGSIITIYY